MQLYPVESALVQTPSSSPLLRGRTNWLLWLQVSEFSGDILDARAILLRIQVVMTYDQGFRIAPVQIFEQQSECSLLRCGTRVGGLTADIEPALIADANRVGVVVLAVGTDHVLRTAWLYLSVTTDNVVVADAELKAPLAVPGIYLSGRARLVGPHCRTMQDNQGNDSHLFTVYR